MAGRVFDEVRLFLGRVFDFVKKDIRKRPFLNFYLALLGFVLLILLSNFWSGSNKKVEVSKNTKEVVVYRLDKSPSIKTLAKIEKDGVVTVLALAPGVVSSVNAHEGDSVGAGQSLISLSSNYQGGSLAGVGRAIAVNQYKAASETYDLQKGIISKSRNLAEKSGDNADKLREITNDSRSSTRVLIDTNNDLISRIDSQLQRLSKDGSEYATLAGQKAQLLVGLAAAQASLASSDYQADSDRPPAEMARLQKDLSLRQLDLQEKMLDVSREAARLQVELASVSEAMMSPSAPISGVVQRVFVKSGDFVSPGQKLAVVSQEKDDSVSANVYVNREISIRIDMKKDAVVVAGGKEYGGKLAFVSSEAVEGNLYRAVYELPDEISGLVTVGEYVEVKVPLESGEELGDAVFIPADAVYRSDEGENIFVIGRDNRAVSRKVVLGEVFGGFVEVRSGILGNEQIIVSRNVVAGDKVKN